MHNNIEYTKGNLRKPLGTRAARPHLIEKCGQDARAPGKKPGFRRLPKVCIFVLLAIAPLLGQAQKMDTVTGIVTNSSGIHVPGVKVCSSSYSCVFTDASGRFEKSAPKPVLTYLQIQRSMRFSHPQYDAVIRVVSSDKLDVVLEKTSKESDNKRIIPFCSKDENLIGRRFKIRIASQNFFEGNDHNSVVIRVFGSKNSENEHFQREHLMLLTGPSASSGMPERHSWPFLEQTNAILYNRDVELENQNKGETGIPFFPTIDIKAQSNGNFWRFIGNTFHVITYRDVSEETAREFDDMLDNSLCYDPQ